jgi:hypothetical protein
MDLYKKNEQFKKQLLLRKGIYPYEYMDEISKYEEKSIPPKNCFDSKLSNKSISEDDYLHAKTVFNTFHCKNLREYTELYCQVDTALLAEIMTQFRSEILQECNLDFCKYISLPQLSLDLMLKMTNNEIELLTDIDQILIKLSPPRMFPSTIKI